ncbi:shikimate dehydrogenase [Alteromonas halophila]|uniref:Shikimate dehydrogenase (NADP(+)) n=1 Tax=Alteromonas halophila TaxID=516698 RepID=A0A918JRT2_9ALTE|nr:shikimate dehydrogenase [Alteromonas halophila]GGW96165.1 shikimate dehydrogenase (NADP(+)) [Alteromonas halophila]
MKKFAVFGNPIAHSLSPDIHQMFAESCDQDIQYSRICAGEDTFEDEVRGFFDDPNAVGCNVTVPFKTRAFVMADVKDDAACVARALNTLMKVDGKYFGYNTDGMGLVRDLAALDISLQGKQVSLLGAGGAARGVIMPLLNAGVEKVAIINRTLAKAQALVDEVADTRVQVASPDQAGGQLIINSTSASLHHELPQGVAPTLFTRCEMAYDMVYASQPTSFMKYACEYGAENQADGLGMLVEQAAAAFHIWTGCNPATFDVKERLRARLSQ